MNQPNERGEPMVSGPAPMQRISVVGSSGAGKTTMARALGQRLNLGHIELDAIYHQADWTHPEAAEFVRQVDAAMTDAEASHGGWVMCGDYEHHLGGLRDERSDTIVWLDLRRALVMSRVTRRTVRRAVKREVLWNGNRESLTNFYRWDPELNVIRWAWTHFEEKRTRYEGHLRSGTWDQLSVHRLQSPAEVDQFLANVRR